MTRNPMYLAGVLLVSGVALLLGSVMPLLIAVGFSIRGVGSTLLSQKMLSALTILRCIALLAFAVPMLIRRTVDHRTAGNASGGRLGSRLPFLANVGAWSLFAGLLIVRSEETAGLTALYLAATGAVVAAGGSAVIQWSRANLGEAWSFIPTAAAQSGLVSTGPYRLVRHPIYLGLSLVALGQAIAFSSRPAFLVVLVAVIPTLLWRARVEEAMLTTVFGDRYLHYKTRTRMIVPYVF
ncbi:MAG: methyltransferase [Acidobacteriota bacterium]